MHSATLDNPPISYSVGPLYLARFTLYLMLPIDIVKLAPFAMIEQK